MMNTAATRAGDVTAERAKRTVELAIALRLFADHGFDEGAGGHITARDPEQTDCFWVNPFGASFATIKVRDLILVNHEGRVIQGSGTINPAGFVIHSQIHASRPDLVAVAHSHSTYGRAWAALGRTLDPITQDACSFYERHAVHEDFSGVVLAEEQAKGIAADLADMKALILQNHGLLTAGESVGEATWWFMAMDSACRVQLLAEAAGDPRKIDAASARQTAELMGTAKMARLNYRPIHAAALQRHNDIMD